MDNLFLLLFLVSIIALIVGFIKPELVVRWGSEEKKNRKSVLKVYGLAIIAFFILFAITTPPSNNEEVKEKVEVEKEIKEKEEVEKEVKEKEEVEEEAKEKEEVEEDEVKQGYSEQMLLTIMKESFDGIADVTYNNEYKAFIILPTDEAFVEELNALVAGNQIILESWNNLVDGMISASESLRDNYGRGYSIHLLNPANKDNVLLSIVDGIVIYNIADEL